MRRSLVSKLLTTAVFMPRLFLILPKLSTAPGETVQAAPVA